VTRAGTARRAPLRTALFWLHLASGAVAGLAIAVMCLTGALLAGKPQVLDLLERDGRVVTPAGSRLEVSTLLERLVRQRPDARPSSITLSADPADAVVVALGRDEVVYQNPYSGEMTGGGAAGARRFFRRLEDWQRWLGATGASRGTARAINDAANAAFLLLAISGLYLWWPRRWLPQHVTAILWFRRGLSGRARDFNWHNAIGVWCAPLLIVLTATGVVMSYSWANDLVYRFAGDTPPSRAAGAGPPRVNDRAERGAVAIRGGIDRAWARAGAAVPGWRSIAMRWPSGPEASFSIDEGTSWNPFARSQLVVSLESGEVLRWEAYTAVTPGRRMRQWVRFGHTGELAGWPGQLLAGMACVGGLFLTWTGMALALRRWSAWRARTASRQDPAVRVA
jgi:uncharacterized iron-regulated membrane protein